MTEVVTKFADGEYRFWMAMPQVIAFETEHGSILDFYGKLSVSMGQTADGEFKFVGEKGPSCAAMRDYIRLALIGGNQGLVDEGEIEVNAVKAKDLIDTYLYPAIPSGLQELAELSFKIVYAAVKGVRISSKKKTEIVTSEPSPSDAEPSSPTAEP